MKQFAKPFLSVLLLLSAASVLADNADGRSGGSRSRSGVDCSEKQKGCSEERNHSENNKSKGCSKGCSTENGSEHANDCHGCQSSIILPRPQNRDTAAFFFPYLYGADMGDQCATAQIGFRYQQSFKGHRLAECLFGSDTLVFEGSQFGGNNDKGRSDKALVADYFGLSPLSKSKVKFDPRIRDYMVDFSGRVELGPWMECLEGAYFQLNATAVHSKWELRPCETVATASGDGKFPTCYMSDVAVSTVADLDVALSENNSPFGDVQSRRFANFRHSKSKTALANIDLILGYDFLLCDTYHLGLFLLGSAPTGNRPDPRFVFSPIVGNGHHWELGGGLSAHYELWNCDDQSIGAYLDGHVEHLFKDTQRRTFDFKRAFDENGDKIAGHEGKGCLSRYLLLKEFDKNGDYSGHVIPAANFTTRQVESSFKVQGDASLRLLYRACGWAAGVGYNVYGRTHERLHLTNCCDEFKKRNLGIKGTTGVCVTTDDSSVPLSATQNFARITTVSDDVDNQEGVNDATTWNGISPAPESLKDGQPAPVLVSKKDLNVEGVPSYLTHKVFAHVDYQWDDCECKPYLGVGGEAEFANKHESHPCTVNKWGVWVRTGVSF